MSASDLLSPILISLKTAITATAITFVLGLAAARWMTGMKSRMRNLLDGIFILPLVLPPTVVGLGLLLLFGRSSPIGELLAYFGKTVVFSWSATVIAATTVAFPLMYQTTRGAFEQIDPNIIDAARTLGCSEWRIFWRVTVPVAWPGIMAGLALSFARALGEFGATLMLAGSLPGRTETIPIAIYFAVEGGHMSQALYWVAIVLIISFASIIALNHWKSSHAGWQSASAAESGGEITDADR